MKNVFLTLALAATLGLVSCGGQSQQAPATEEVVEEVEIDSTTIGTTTDPEEDLGVVEESEVISEDAPVQE
jgi:ABC-type glycerol-3-phosphate transport system substrate-binding protein